MRERRWSSGRSARAVHRSADDPLLRSPRLDHAAIFRLEFNSTSLKAPSDLGPADQPFRCDLQQCSGSYPFRQACRRQVPARTRRSNSRKPPLGTAVVELQHDIVLHACIYAALAISKPVGRSSVASTDEWRHTRVKVSLGRTVAVRRAAPKRPRGEHLEAEAQHWSSPTGDSRGLGRVAVCNDRFAATATPRPARAIRQPSDAQSQRRSERRQWIQHLRLARWPPHESAERVPMRLRKWSRGAIDLASPGVRLHEQPEHAARRPGSRLSRARQHVPSPSARRFSKRGENIQPMRCEAARRAPATAADRAHFRDRTRACRLCAGYG